MIRKSALATTIAALLNPVVAGALGLGNIEVSSALSEPLNARIPLRGALLGEIDELKAALGSDDQFLRAGLNRVFILSTLRFKVVPSSGTRGHIQITSHEPISEPFLNFLVDVNWANGRVVREYTVLLDPPVYGAAIRSATKRQVETVAVLPKSKKAMQKPPPAADKATPSYSASTVPSMTATSPASAAPSGFSGDSYGPVSRGETLWSIADKVRPGDASIQSMMLALLRANPQAFSLDNVNALKTGAVLRLPAASDERDDRAQALAEVARQHGLWDEYRQSISASGQARPGGAAAQAPMADIGASASAATDDKAGAMAGGSDNPVLKLVGSGTTGAATDGSPNAEADIQALRDDLSMAQEEADAAKLENTKLNSRLDELGGIVEGMQRLMEMREEELAVLQNKLAGSEQASAAASSTTMDVPKAAGKVETLPAVPVVAVEPKPKTEPTPVKAKVEPPPALKPQPAAEPPSSLDEVQSLLGELEKFLPVPLWAVLAGLGTLLLGFGGLRMARSRKGDAVDSEEMVAPSINPGGSLIDRYAQTELSATDAGDDDETQMPSTSSPDAETEIGDDHDKTQLAPEVSAEPGIGTGTGTGDEDPLAEVNVYLAYERFDKAEQLVRDGIDAHPQRPEYQLKLLEVFYAAKNTASFESSAEQLKTTVGAESELMSQAHAWWDELGTGRALFSDSDGPSTTEHSEAPSDDADGDDLFDFTAAQTGEQTSVDFELGFDDPSAEGTGASGDLNFDLGAVGDDSSANGDGSLDFDLGGFESTDNGPATQAMAAGAVGAVAAGLATGVDFDLGDGTSSDEFQSADSGLDFDLDTGDANEVPTAAGIAGDDGSLDIDLGGFDDAEQPAGQSAEGGGGLDFDLDDGTDSWLDLASLDDSTDVGALDFDLGDTSTLPKFEASATSVDELPAVEDDGLDLQLDTGSDGDDVSLALDMDTVIDGAASELDFDLGDIGAGDAGAGTMHGGVDPFADTGTADDSLALDIDLGSTDVISRVMDDESIANEISDFSENGLDFDLGDTGGDAAAAVEVPLDFGLALDLQTDANSSDDEPLALDMGLDAIGDGSVATVFQDARTEISDGSELDLDLGFDSGDDAEDFGLPILEADDDGDLAIDTVQLAPAAAQALRRSAEAFGTSTSESLGFDLGTGLDDAENSVGFGALDADLEQTQFSLRDVQSLPNDDEEDHTLVLGRSDASGEVDEMQTKLDLAQAYMDMGDTEGARNLLGEVMADGGDEQQRNASEMLSKLS